MDYVNAQAVMGGVISGIDVPEIKYDEFGSVCMFSEEHLKILSIIL